jgi:hypothetical protein
MLGASAAESIESLAEPTPRSRPPRARRRRTARTSASTRTTTSSPSPSSRRTPRAAPPRPRPRGRSRRRHRGSCPRLPQACAVLAWQEGRKRGCWVLSLLSLSQRRQRPGFTTHGCQAAGVWRVCPASVEPHCAVCNVPSRLARKKRLARPQAANVADSLNRLALRGKMTSEEAADASAAAEAAIASQRALGQVGARAGQRLGCATTGACPCQACMCCVSHAPCPCLSCSCVSSKLAAMRAVLPRLHLLAARCGAGGAARLAYMRCRAAFLAHPTVSCFTCAHACNAPHSGVCVLLAVSDHACLDEGMRLVVGAEPTRRCMAL